MGLYKRKGKAGTTWCVQYFAHGKRVRESIGPSKRQAELVLAKRKADIREGRYFDVRKDHRLTVGDLLDRYLNEYAVLHKAPRSHLRYVASANVLKAYFGEKLVKDVTPEDVHAFILHRNEQDKAAATINGEVATLFHRVHVGKQAQAHYSPPGEGCEQAEGEPEGALPYLRRDSMPTGSN